MGLFNKIEVYMKQKLIEAYLAIRKFSSRIIYEFVKVPEDKLPQKWDEIKKLPMYEFSKVLGKYEYKSDPFGGAIDYSPRNPNSFFVDKKNGRDCDDWARMWFWWCIENGKTPVYEVAICEKTNLVASHMVCIFEEQGEFFLLDYTPVGRFKTMEECALHNNVGIKDPIVAIYRKAV